MAKSTHEIRDPIHVFIRLMDDERKVLDSRPFQRLRHIHQLALTYLVYPGATHRRFEHSLGVMELAGKVFDVVTLEEHLAPVREQLPSELFDARRKHYWRCALRMAALCHDIGHLPFSHAAEKALLPESWNHERLTAELIRSEEMRTIWKKMKLEVEDIVKLALGPKEATDEEFTMWETILSEIIVGDAFGVDRMDYLLRDSHHAGVAYGKFDHYRLVDTLRILPSPPSDRTGGGGDIALGVELGGIQSAEALMLARYFMYSQVYFHPIRRIYDRHLQDFLSAWLESGKFSTDIASHIEMTDNEVTTAMLAAARDSSKPGHDDASRIVNREHFKVLYERNPEDRKVNPEAGEAIFNGVVDKFGAESARHDRYRQRSGIPDFPVLMRDKTVVPSISASSVLRDLPVVSVDYVFVDRNIWSQANDWLTEAKDTIIQPEQEGDS